MRKGPQALPVQAPPLSRQALDEPLALHLPAEQQQQCQGEQARHHQPHPGHDAAPLAARAAKRSFQAGRAPGKGSAVAE